MAVDEAGLSLQVRFPESERWNDASAGRRSEIALVPMSGGRRFDLTRFDLSDMIECGRAIRTVTGPARSMEEAGGAIVRLLYESLGDAEGQRNCALVRCFKTHRFGQLPGDLETIARGLLTGGEGADPEMPCLTLLATAGEGEGWNDRRRSSGHAAIPLESVDFVEWAPMIAALLQQMGLQIESALRPSEQIILDAEQHAFSVFHVEEAEGSEAIPGQEFVRSFGIRSVLGFGGLLPSGDLFAVILFARVRIPRATADLFRTIALGVKLALLPFTRGPVWTSELEDSHVSKARGGAPGIAQFEDEQLRSEIATLKLLIPALEQAALDQTERLKGAVSDLRRQAEHVRQQGLRLSAMLEATTDAVFLLDRNWRFTFLNSHAQRLIAGDRDLLGFNIWEMFPEAVGKEFWIQYRRAMYEGMHVQFQEHYPEPLEKWFEVHAFPSEDGVAVFFHDITDRLKTEATLRQTEKLAATGRMAASIAHEINNPLESVTNLLYLLGGDKEMSAQGKEWVKMAESELARVSEITTHMLRFYRQSTDRTEVELGEVLGSVLVLFQGRIAQAGVRVERRLKPTRTLRAYAGELRQVFANLVGNALDASASPGGWLMLRMREGCCPRAGVEGLRVTIADTGCGMSSAVLGRLFEPFFTTKGITGTGLGLWVSLQLVRKHGGTVRVRSSNGEERHGTVFSVFFPFAGGGVGKTEAQGLGLV
jgi:signal transduction histidine kinase